MQATTAGNRDSSTNSDDAESKRRKTTQACDYCRQKRTKCDNAKPRCNQCAKAGILCTFFTHSKKRGPIPREELEPEARQAAIDHASGRQIVKPKSTRVTGPLQLTHYENLRPRFNTLRTSYPLHHSYFGNPNQTEDHLRRLAEEGHTQAIEASSLRPPEARGDLWRKELTDHLVELFFEHCFQDFDIFDPKEFLKEYAERKVNQSLLNAICAVAARFSDHPDIVQVPPYHSGEPYAEKTRERIMDLIDEATIDNLYALIILSFYEYSAWSGPRGWRFGGLASRMGVELYLHKQRDIPTSERARVKFEAKCRTFWNLIHIDIFSAASAGLPSILDIKLYNIQLPEYRPDWWVEKYQELEAAIIGEVQEDSDIQEAISTQSETLPKDPFTARILAKLQEPRRLRGYGPAKCLFEPIELLSRVSQYINGNTLESDKCPSDPTSEFAVLEGRLTTWKASQEIPSTPVEIVESEDNFTYMVLTYYMTVIMLHRPIISLEDVVDASFIDQSRARCAEAATKITEIVEHFNETDIKYRGHLFVFQVFTGAAIHVTNIFSSDDDLAASAKRCLNVHLNFLKISSPHWTVSARLYFILQDLYSAQVTVHTQSESSTSASAAATPHDRSGSESQSDRASSSGAKQLPMPAAIESMQINHTSDRQDLAESDSVTNRKRPLVLLPGSTPLNFSNTGSEDAHGDVTTAQKFGMIGIGHEELGHGHGEANPLADGTKRPNKKVKKVAPLSRLILPRPLIPDTSTTLPAVEGSMMLNSALGLAATEMGPPTHGSVTSAIPSKVTVTPLGKLLPPPPPQSSAQPVLQPSSLQVSGQSGRHLQPIATSPHSLDAPPHLLPDLGFFDSRSLEAPISTLSSHRDNLSRGPEHQYLQTEHQHQQAEHHHQQAEHQRNITSMTAITLMNNVRLSSSSSMFNPYDQGRTLVPYAPNSVSVQITMPFDVFPTSTMTVGGARGFARQPSYAPSFPPPSQWGVEAVGGNSAPVSEIHSQSLPSAPPPPVPIHSYSGLLQTSSAGGGEIFDTGLSQGPAWAMDQDIVFGGRAAPWPAGIAQERDGAREEMMEYRRLQDKQQEFMSTRFMRQMSVDLGATPPPLTSLALDSYQGGRKEYDGSSIGFETCGGSGDGVGGGGGGNLGMRSFEEASSVSLAPFAQHYQQQSQPQQPQQPQQSQQPQQPQQPQQLHVQQPSQLQYSTYGFVMQPPLQRPFQFQLPPQYPPSQRQQQQHVHQQCQQQQEYPAQHQQQQQQEYPAQHQQQQHPYPQPPQQQQQQGQQQISLQTYQRFYAQRANQPPSGQPPPHY
ncbi:hypothetical protein EC991_003947 [Linnemannia zychae]|nr:hypothetical protein EC991_003947 [Linnemannia zychae]